MSKLAMSHIVEDRRLKATHKAVERIAELYTDCGKVEDSEKAIKHAEYLKLKIQENNKS